MSRALRISTAVVLTGLAVAATPPAGIAQEATVFELVDFVDPQALGGTFTDDDGFLAGLRYLSVIASGGWISDYQERNVFSDEAFAFAHLSVNYYAGRSQWTFNLTGLDASTDDFVGRGLPALDLGPAGSIATYRARLKWGRYLRYFEPQAGSKEDSPREDPPVARRRPYSLMRSSFWIAAERLANGDTVPDLGFALDVQDAEDFLGDLDFLGSLVLGWKLIDGRADEYRISYLVQNRWYKSDRGFELRSRLGISGERTFGHWRWGTARYEFSLDIPVFSNRGVLHVVATPARRFRSRGIEKSWNHELALFLDASLVARLFQPDSRDSR